MDSTRRYYTKRNSERGGGLSGCVPGALTGIPVDFGAKLKHNGINQRYERKTIPSSFVFAYRLREVRYFKKDNSTRDIDFTKGAELHDLYGHSYVPSQAGVDEETYFGTEDEIDVDGIFGEGF